MKKVLLLVITILIFTNLVSATTLNETDLINIRLFEYNITEFSNEWETNNKSLETKFEQPGEYQFQIEVTNPNGTKEKITWLLNIIKKEATEPVVQTDTPSSGSSSRRRSSSSNTQTESKQENSEGKEEDTTELFENKKETKEGQKYLVGESDTNLEKISGAFSAIKNKKTPIVASLASLLTLTGYLYSKRKFKNFKEKKKLNKILKKY